MLCSHQSLYTVTHPAPFSLPWALQDEFKALLDGRSLAEHASRRRLKQEFGYCSGGSICQSGSPCDRYCSDKGMDKDACVFFNLATQCQWNDMTVPAIITVSILLCIVVGCCCCCCRRERGSSNRNSMSMPLNVTVMQPGMMQPVLMQPGMMQPVMMQPGVMQPGMMQMPRYQQMSGKA
jgi:hypothetical protein